MIDWVIVRFFRVAGSRSLYSDYVCILSVNPDLYSIYLFVSRT